MPTAIIDALPFEHYQMAAEYILERIPNKPTVGIVLGSSMGGFAESIDDAVTIDYKDIPGFLRSTVASHAGKLIFGKKGGKYICCMSGRFHFYEGYDFEQLAIPVRVLKLVGVQKLILTNAAGAVNASYKVGDIMLISDQIKLMGGSPMRGANASEFGARFFDVSDLYTKSLRELAWSCINELGEQYRTHEGVYFFMPGPQFETPAEIRAIRLLGGDAVGMSTVTEALTAAHCGMEVLGISVMTNMAAGILPVKLSDEEVGVTAKATAERLEKIINAIIAKM